MHTRKYTLGDAFCGAGGVSRGAVDAGLHVEWGFDDDEQAMDSYEANFGRLGTDCLREAVFDFLQTPQSVVDILHCSPPCQTFSWAKTVKTPEQDEKNEAVLFSIGQPYRQGQATHSDHGGSRCNGQYCRQ